MGQKQRRLNASEWCYDRFTQWCVSYDLYSYKLNIFEDRELRGGTSFCYFSFSRTSGGATFIVIKGMARTGPCGNMKRSVQKGATTPTPKPPWCCLGVLWGGVDNLEFWPLKIFWQLKGVMLEVLESSWVLESVGHFFRVGCQLPSFLLMISFLFRTGIYLIYSPTQDIGYQWHFLRFYTDSLCKKCKDPCDWRWHPGVDEVNGQPNRFSRSTPVSQPMGSPRSPRQYPKEVCIALEERFFTRGGPGCRLQICPSIFSQLELVDW